MMSTMVATGDVLLMGGGCQPPPMTIASAKDIYCQECTDDHTCAHENEYECLLKHHRLVPKPRGSAHKTMCPTTILDTQMMDYILFIQGRGDTADQGLSKTFPADAHKAMRLLGTIQGEKFFNSTEKDKAFMRQNQDGRRTFKLSQLLSATQLKQYMSKTRVSLLSQRDRMVTKEAREARSAADPLYRRIQELTREQVLKKIRSIYERHDGLVPVNLETKARAGGLILGDLKDVLYKGIVETYQRDENDVKLVMNRGGRN